MKLVQLENTSTSLVMHLFLFLRLGKKEWSGWTFFTPLAWLARAWATFPLGDFSSTFKSIWSVTILYSGQSYLLFSWQLTFSILDVFLLPSYCCLYLCTTVSHLKIKIFPNLTDFPLHYNWCFFSIDVIAITFGWNSDYLHFIRINAVAE